MGAITDRIAELEEEIKNTKSNKVTQGHLGLIKARIARLKAEQEVFVKKSSGRTGPAYAVKKTGDATVLFVGFPSVGKSTLLNSLTNADSKVAAYEFTTLDVIPGLMDYKGAKIQLLDVPGMIEGAHRGRGRGKEIFSVVRNADLILAIIDKPSQLRVIQDELYRAGLRLNERPPDITIKKKFSGGVHLVASMRLTQVTSELIMGVLAENGIHNADVVVRQDVNVDQLIDAVVGNRRYVPLLVLINKADVLSPEAVKALQKEAGSSILISAQKEQNLGELREAIFRGLEFTRIYMKKIGQEPDYSEPLILKRDHSVRGACLRVHKEWEERFQYARVWGKGAKFDGQTVGIDHVLEDGDVLELHLRR